VIEGRALFFIECDPGGDACHLLSGFCQETLEQAVGGATRVAHTMCQSRGDSLCRWVAEVDEPYTRVPTPKSEAEA
jgi:predicted hydrocarbon binding protein